MSTSTFRELSEDENEVILEARACGYATYYPAYPDSEAQARNTLAGARKWLKTHRIPVSPDDPG